MTIKFMLLGLKDTQILKDVTLGNTGLTTYDEYFVLGKLEGYFDTFEEAIKEGEKLKYTDGFKIETVYFN